jgi:hypothetical protein
MVAFLFMKRDGRALRNIAMDFLPPQKRYPDMTSHPDTFTMFAAHFPNATQAQIRALLDAGSTAERLVAMTALCPSREYTAGGSDNEHQAAADAHS